MKWYVWVLLAILAVVAYWAPGPGQTVEDVARREDMNRLRNLAGLLVATAKDGMLPMKDGAVDVYGLVRKGDLVGAELRWLISERTGACPTFEELMRDDYANFAWERYRGDGKLKGPPFPLLWEKEPDEAGGGIVALSDGSGRYLERAEFEALRTRQAR